MEFNIKKILVPVDFTPASLNALDTAIGMAKRHEAGILLLNVVETGGLSGYTSDGASMEESILAMIHHSEQELQTIQHSVIERFQVSCEVIAATGIVSAAITKISAAHHADIIVMGAHGTTGFRESFIGINAFNVVKNATCPVLTVPSQKKWESFKKILFPVRPIPAAIEKYDFIRKIIRNNDATLKVLGLVENYDHDVELIKDLASQLNDKLKEDKVQASVYFKVGENMAEEVLKMATILDSDLIVVTTTLDASCNQCNVIGPFTKYVFNHAHFPVLSVKPSNADKPLNVMPQHLQNTFSQTVSQYN